MVLGEKNINFSISSKVVAAVVIGTGVVVGVGTAFLYSRINSNLNNLVSHIQSTIKEVKDDLAVIENELCDLHGPAPLRGEKSVPQKRRKTVSFSSSTSESYRTASSERSFHTAHNDTFSDSGSFITAAPGYETEYFSPDEDDEEFFDFSPSEDETYSSSNGAQKRSSIISSEVSDFSGLIKRFDALIDRTPEEQEEAFNLIMNSGFEGNAEILWRKAKASRNLALIEENEGNLEGKKNHIMAGYEFAKEALAINDQSADTNKWVAVLSGSMGEFLSTSERIASGQTFKKHIDIAVKISPNDPSLYHLLGRFCYEVSMLSWVERKVASTLFGEVPSSSFDEALGHFMSAEQLRSDPWKANKFFVAKSLMQLHRLYEAESWTKDAIDIPPVTSDDVIMDKEINEFVVKYSLRV